MDCSEWVMKVGIDIGVVDDDGVVDIVVVVAVVVVAAAAAAVVVVGMVVKGSRRNWCTVVVQSKTIQCGDGGLLERGARMLPGKAEQHHAGCNRPS